jgi:hypothetical protein
MKKDWLVKTLALGIIILFIGVAIQPGISTSIKQEEKTDKELDLLYGEIGFYISIPAGYDNSFNVTYSLPPIYENQSPIFFEILNDTTAKIISYRILNDTAVPNKVVKFNIASSQYEELPFVHFDFWVLVKNDEFIDFVMDTKIPKKEDLPDETKIWLTSTEAVQSNNFFIKLKALSLILGNNNLTLLADKIVKYTSEHKMRLVLWTLANLIPINPSGWAKFLDAVSSLLFGGSCTGRANLGTALFRAKGVPARVIHVMPTWPWAYVKDNNIWYDMHYISEYYSPANGWVLSETVLGITPLEQKQNIVLRVNYTDDENLAGNRLKYYGGCEQWFWTESKNIRLFWNHSGSGTRSWFNNNITTDKETANQVFNITQKVYTMFTKYAGLNLTGENQQHFYNATLAQKNSIQQFMQLDVNGYLENITLAYDQYNEIYYP